MCGNSSSDTPGTRSWWLPSLGDGTASCCGRGSGCHPLCLSPTLSGAGRRRGPFGREHRLALSPRGRTVFVPADRLGLPGSAPWRTRRVVAPYSTDGKSRPSTTRATSRAPLAYGPEGWWFLTPNAIPLFMGAPHFASEGIPAACQRVQLCEGEVSARRQCEGFSWGSSTDSCRNRHRAATLRACELIAVRTSRRCVEFHL